MHLQVKARIPVFSNLNCINFDPGMGRLNEEDQMPATGNRMTSVKNPRQDSSISRPNKNKNGKRYFETWHQRLAHCSEKRIRQTQKLVEGIPAFYGPKIPDLVTCRTCDVAKLRNPPVVGTSMTQMHW